MATLTDGDGMELTTLESLAKPSSRPHQDQNGEASGHSSASHPLSPPHATSITLATAPAVNEDMESAQEAFQAGPSQQGHSIAATLTGQATTLAMATTLTHLPSSMAAPPPPPIAAVEVPAEQGAPGNAVVQEEAIRVRSNILRAMWYSLAHLWKPRLIFFLLRTSFSIIQIVACIVVMALPSSLGNSPSGGDIDGDPPREGSQCDPEPIFIYIALHTLRLVVLLPLDTYLTLSPHGNARQRRPGARDFEQRERNRTFGNLARDRKVAKVVDLLSFAQCVLFGVGNWTVWTRTECSRPPAESIPLFYTGLSMLCIIYLYILIILLITTMVVFFLPIFLVILRVLGITRHLPQPDIRPETGKVEKDEVEKVTRLVYYVDEDEWLNWVRGSRQERSSFQQLRMSKAWAKETTETSRADVQMASQVALPATPARPVEGKEAVFLVQVVSGATISRSDEDNLTTTDGLRRNKEAASTSHSATSPRDAALVPRHRRPRSLFAALLPTSRRGRQIPTVEKVVASQEAELGACEESDGVASFSADADAGADGACTASKAPGKVTKYDRQLRYPLHPLPTHRSTCPICLCDYESPLQTNSAPVAPTSASNSSPEASAASVVEPLRLLPCQHVLHVSCIDEWLTTVSGRCPICQRPVLNAGGEEAEVTVGGGGQVGRDIEEAMGQREEVGQGAGTETAARQAAS